MSLIRRGRDKIRGCLRITAPAGLACNCYKNPPIHCPYEQWHRIVLLTRVYRQAPVVEQERAISAVRRRASAFFILFY